MQNIKNGCKKQKIILGALACLLAGKDIQHTFYTLMTFLLDMEE